MFADYALLAPAWLLLLPTLWWLWRRPGNKLAELLLRPVALRHPQAAHPLPAVEVPDTGRSWLPAVVLGLLLLALAQPVRYGAPLPERPSPLQLMLVVDTSISMALRDYQLDGRQLDRLSLAKILLDRFVADFNGSEVGLVVFGQPPALWVPPTADRALFRRLLARLQPVMAGRYAALGDALALAAEQFPARADVPRAVVLITDAVQPGGRLSPQQGVKKLQAAGLTLHTIAIGAGGGALQQGKSELLYEPADLALLQALAEATGGLSFHARAADDLRDALTRIEALHTAQMPPPAAQRVIEPLYHWPLLLALLLLGVQPWLRDLGRRRLRHD